MPKTDTTRRAENQARIQIQQQAVQPQAQFSQVTPQPIPQFEMGRLEAGPQLRGPGDAEILFKTLGSELTRAVKTYQSVKDETEREDADKLKKEIDEIRKEVGVTLDEHVALSKIEELKSKYEWEKGTPVDNLWWDEMHRFSAAANKDLLGDKMDEFRLQASKIPEVEDRRNFWRDTINNGNSPPGLEDLIRAELIREETGLAQETYAMLRDKAELDMMAKYDEIINDPDTLFELPPRADAIINMSKAIDLIGDPVTISEFIDPTSGLVDIDSMTRYAEENGIELNHVTKESHLKNVDLARKIYSNMETSVRNAKPSKGRARTTLSTDESNVSEYKAAGKTGYYGHHLSQINEVRENTDRSLDGILVEMGGNLFINPIAVNTPPTLQIRSDMEVPLDQATPESLKKQGGFWGAFLNKFDSAEDQKSIVRAYKLTKKQWDEKVLQTDRVRRFQDWDRVTKNELIRAMERESVLEFNEKGLAVSYREGEEREIDMVTEVFIEANAASGNKDENLHRARGMWIGHLKEMGIDPKIIDGFSKPSSNSNNDKFVWFLDELKSDPRFHHVVAINGRTTLRDPLDALEGLVGRTEENLSVAGYDEEIQKTHAINNSILETLVKLGVPLTDFYKKVEEEYNLKEDVFSSKGQFQQFIAGDIFFTTEEGNEVYISDLFDVEKHEDQIKTLNQLWQRNLFRDSNWETVDLIDLRGESLKRGQRDGAILNDLRKLTDEEREEAIAVHAGVRGWGLFANDLSDVIDAAGTTDSTLRVKGMMAYDNDGNKRFIPEGADLNKVRYEGLTLVNNEVETFYNPIAFYDWGRTFADRMRKNPNAEPDNESSSELWRSLQEAWLEYSPIFESSVTTFDEKSQSAFNSMLLFHKGLSAGSAGEIDMVEAIRILSTLTGSESRDQVDSRSAFENYGVAQAGLVTQLANHLDAKTNIAFFNSTPDKYRDLIRGLDPNGGVIIEALVEMNKRRFQQDISNREDNRNYNNSENMVFNLFGVDTTTPISETDAVKYIASFLRNRLIVQAMDPTAFEKRHAGGTLSDYDLLNNILSSIETQINESRGKESWEELDMKDFLRLLWKGEALGGALAIGGISVGDPLPDDHFLRDFIYLDEPSWTLWGGLESLFGMTETTGEDYEGLWVSGDIPTNWGRDRSGLTWGWDRLMDTDEETRLKFQTIIDEVGLSPYPLLQQELRPVGNSWSGNDFAAQGLQSLYMLARSVYAGQRQRAMHELLKNNRISQTMVGLMNIGTAAVQFQSGSTISHISPPNRAPQMNSVTQGTWASFARNPERTFIKDPKDVIRERTYINLGPKAYSVWMDASRIRSEHITNRESNYHKNVILDTLFQPAVRDDEKDGFLPVGTFLRTPDIETILGGRMVNVLTSVRTKGKLVSMAMEIIKSSANLPKDFKRQEASEKILDKYKKTIETYAPEEGTLLSFLEAISQHDPATSRDNPSGNLGTILGRQSLGEISEMVKLNSKRLNGGNLGQRSYFTHPDVFALYRPAEVETREDRIPLSGGPQTSYHIPRAIVNPDGTFSLNFMTRNKDGDKYYSHDESSPMGWRSAAGTNIVIPAAWLIEE